MLVALGYVAALTRPRPEFGEPDPAAGPCECPRPTVTLSVHLSFLPHATTESSLPSLTNPPCLIPFHHPVPASDSPTLCRGYPDVLVHGNRRELQV